MNPNNWVYLGQLLRALQNEGMDGRRIGELVAEIDTHLAESGVDPVEEFGTPGQLASELAERPGSRRPGWVPPLWVAHLTAGLLLLLLLPLLTPGEWSDTSIPVAAHTVAFVVILYVGIFWLGYQANRRVDGRRWVSFLQARMLFWLFVVAVITTLAVNASGQRVLWEAPKVPYLIGAALVIPVLVVAIARWQSPVRFPANARHLDRLRRGPLAGTPPANERTGPG
jgi:hypothetical protein